MAINPVDNHPLLAGYAGLSAGRKEGAGASAFDTLLGSMGGPSGSVSSTGGRVAAELLRIEMMQSSLSLVGPGEGETSPSSGIKALESLLARFAANKPAAADGEDGRVAAEAAGSPVEGAQSASPGQGEEADDGAEGIGRTAARFLGTPYRFGGEGPAGIDCSSFVQQVFREHQVELPRTAREQSQVGSEVAAGELRKGDLVFFQTYASYPSHVGIYLGDGKMIHASSAKGEVTVSDMNSDYYRSRFLGAKRVA